VYGHSSCSDILGPPGEIVVNVDYTRRCGTEAIELESSGNIRYIDKIKDEKYEFDAMQLFTVSPPVSDDECAVIKSIAITGIS